MDSVIIDEILEELSSTLQKVESQSAAVLELIKDKGIVREEELAPYLQRASAASSVRSRAMRVRLAALLAGLDKSELQAKEHDMEEKENQQAREHRQANEPEMAEKRDKSEAPAQSSKLEGSADKRQQTIDEAASQEQATEKTHPEKTPPREPSEPGRRTNKNPGPSKLAG
jgi:hypothetical protein